MRDSLLDADITEITIPMIIPDDTLKEMMDKDFILRPAGWHFNGFVSNWYHQVVNNIPSTILWITINENALVENLNKNQIATPNDQIEDVKIPQILDIYQTCFACPSQWKISLSDDTRLHVRYRNGDFTVRKDDDMIHYEVISRQADGVMDIDEMLGILKTQKIAIN